MIGKKLSSKYESALVTAAKARLLTLNAGPTTAIHIQLQVPRSYLPPVTWTMYPKIVDWRICGIGVSDAI